MLPIRSLSALALRLSIRLDLFADSSTGVMRDFRLCASVKRRKLDPAALSRSLHVSASIHRNRDDRTIAIIGGGLGGLSTAHFVLKSLSPAARARTRICIVERQAQTGGWCRTERFDIHGKPVVFETGPRSLRPVGLSGWLTIQMVRSVCTRDRSASMLNVGCARRTTPGSTLAS